MSNSKIILAVFSGYGSCDIPKWLLKDLPTPIYGIESRIKLAQLLEELEPTCKSCEDGDIQQLWNDFAKSRSLKHTPYFKVDGDNKVYLKTSNENETLFYEVEVSIKEVDITKPWRLVEYDGGEYIEVFNGVTVKDEKYNLCEW